jgi:hypothetical protein
MSPERKPYREKFHHCNAVALSSVTNHLLTAEFAIGILFDRRANLRRSDVGELRDLLGRIGALLDFLEERAE